MTVTSEKYSTLPNLRELFKGIARRDLFRGEGSVKYPDQHSHTKQNIDVFRGINLVYDLLNDTDKYREYEQGRLGSADMAVIHLAVEAVQNRAKMREAKVKEKEDRERLKQIKLDTIRHQEAYLAKLDDDFNWQMIVFDRMNGIEKCRADVAEVELKLTRLNQKFQSDRQLAEIKYI